MTVQIVRNIWQIVRNIWQSLKEILYWLHPLILERLSRIASTGGRCLQSPCLGSARLFTWPPLSLGSGPGQRTGGTRSSAQFPGRARSDPGIKRLQLFAVPGQICFSPRGIMLKRRRIDRTDFGCSITVYSAFKYRSSFHVVHVLQRSDVHQPGPLQTGLHQALAWPRCATLLPW
jgi:hypothetical protein